jgi:transcriptional regulator with XRE-family HTH domain
MAMSAVSRLGIEIRRARMAHGLSQRKLAVAVGLVAHSNIGDYERGKRLAPLDIVVACERALNLPPGALQKWHARALTERADRWFAALVASADED